MTVSRPVALSRLMARNNLDEEKANARIDSQMSNDERSKHATVIIENSSDFETLRRSMIDLVMLLIEYKCSFSHQRLRRTVEATAPAARHSAP